MGLWTMIYRNLTFASSLRRDLVQTTNSDNRRNKQADNVMSTGVAPDRLRAVHLLGGRLQANTLRGVRHSHDKAPF